MNDVHYLSLSEVGQRIQSRELSSVEVTQHLLARIARLDPTLHSYLHVMNESALQQAQQADEEIARGTSVAPCTAFPSP
ncbi:hypothetical protein ERHA55_08500 [Erwinia rhapontici]|nr:amidase family protein [Erwinia rhapontici]BCQ43323.1 hypothetical protein ERHA55_08500 [Erwinia rhapontici]